MNSKGLRGPEIEYPKPPDTVRILVLGDSFTFAIQVNEEQTFVSLLGERLRREHPGLSIETINAGADGWGTVNEYAWFVTEGYRYEPDLVLLMYYVGNDPGDNADLIDDPRDIDGLRLGAERGDPARALRETALRTSVVYNMLEQAVLVKLGANSDAELMGREDLEGEQRIEAATRLMGAVPREPIWGFNSTRKLRGWVISESLLARLREFCSARGTTLVVVEIPTAGQVTFAEATTTPLSAISARNNLPIIDLLDAFRAQSKQVRERLYFQENRHWTPSGHAVTARVLAGEIRRLGLLPAASS